MGNSKTIGNTAALHTRPSYLFSKTNGSGNNKLSLRQLNLNEDLPVMLRWIRYYTGTKESRGTQQYIHQAFEDIISSGFALPLMCVMNNLPVCQIELFQYICSDSSSPINCLPGDYGLRLFNAPEIRNQKQVLMNLLELCLHYAFTLQPVERVICQSDPENDMLNQSFTDSGFHLVHTLQLQLYQTDLYIYCREK